MNQASFVRVHNVKREKKKKPQIECLLYLCDVLRLWRIGGHNE